ncbi:YheT family hydrolase [Rubrivirga sp.]|uniref:YheT family hydrolase n=1 Tax=Rubrivirga sp. TaxID=1885344 RepID=UPI003B52246B
MDVALPPYRPPLALRSGHLQTVLPTLFRRVDGVDYRRERLELDDGDFVDLDWVGRPEGASVAVVAHGLEGSTDRAYVRGMARELARRGWAVCAWNLRGCSGEPNRLLQTYHSGLTEDVGAVVAHALAEGAAEVAVVGFSLGGNVTLKWLGEQGDAVDRRVVAGVGISVPVDLASSSHAMEAWSRRVYMLRFMRSLSGKVAEKAERFDAVPDLDAIRAARTFRQFDGLFTAPVHGFADAEDYWARSSSLPVLSQVRVPTLLVNALDDPFLGPTCFPYDVSAATPDLTLLTPRHGGHVGFVRRGGTFWSEDVAGRFLNAAREDRRQEQ